MVRKKSTQKRLKVGSAKAVYEPQNRIPLRDIYFGAIDATDELDHVSQERVDLFYDTYYLPDGLEPNSYLNGEKFFVYGLKGTGKTSFLRYLEQMVIRENLSVVKPELFRFSSQFPKEIYRDVSEAFLDGREISAEDRATIYRDLDYEDVWKHIILKRISEISNSHPGVIFEDNDEHKQFFQFLNSISSGEKRKKLLKFLPNITAGKVVLSINPSVELDLDFDDKEKREISFHRYSAISVDLFKKLTPIPENPFYLLFDEIDPRTGSGVLFELDCILIRDLATAIKSLNACHAYDSKSTFLLAAIRSEILDRVKHLGKEVHKRIEQFGYSMNWGETGAVDIRHPLIKMICTKIAHSEKRRGILTAEIGNVEEYIWPRYFRKSKFYQLEPKYIMDISWHRPRDFIRMFEFCKQVDGGAQEISESLLSRVQKRYSKSSWSEISHHLTLTIDPFSIEGLEQVLTSIGKEFDVSDFEERILTKAYDHENVARLSRIHKPADVLLNLYRSGAVGTRNKTRVRYVFRGDGEPDFDGVFCMHKGLHRHFSIVSSGRKRNVK